MEMLGSWVCSWLYCIPETKVGPQPRDCKSCPQRRIRLIWRLLPYHVFFLRKSCVVVVIFKLNNDMIELIVRQSYICRLWLSEFFPESREQNVEPAWWTRQPSHTYFLWNAAVYCFICYLLVVFPVVGADVLFTKMRIMFTDIDMSVLFRLYLEAIITTTE